MESKVEFILKIIILIVLTVFWGIVSVFGMLRRIFQIGPKSYFGVRPRPDAPSCLSNHGQHRFVKLSEISMHYVETSGPDLRPVMLFVHGFPEFWYSWRHQMTYFKDRFRCIAVDLRGYGDTDKPEGIANYRSDRLAQDLLELIDTLKIARVTLVAHDWGGAIAQVLALNHPHRVQFLILCNIPITAAFEKHLKTSPKQIWMSWYMFLFQLPYLPELILKSNDFEFIDKVFVHGTKERTGESFSAEDIEAYKYNLSKELTAPINYYRAAMRMPSKKSNSRFAMPVCIIWGVKDTALDVDAAEKSCEYVHDFTLNKVNTAGHWIQQEEPQLTNKYIDEFLKNKK